MERKFKNQIVLILECTAVKNGDGLFPSWSYFDMAE